jgi:DNA polymerase-3 subunit alpha (Gram-positive type)
VDAKNADIMRKANIPDWYIESCNKIKYLFPKAHATAYMIASYICGWYKIYYPIDFYLSYFSIKPDVFDVATIAAGPFAIKEKLDEIQKRLKDPKTKSTVTAKEQSLIDIFNVALEAYARGIKFKNINLEKSDAENFVKEGNDLIIPFKCIDGLGIAVAKSIIEARKEKPFRNKEDLSNRTLVSSKVMTEFINLGILDGMEESDQMSLSSIFD